MSSFLPYSRKFNSLGYKVLKCLYHNHGWVNRLYRFYRSSVLCIRKGWCRHFFSWLQHDGFHNVYEVRRSERMFSINIMKWLFEHVLNHDKMIVFICTDDSSIMIFSPKSFYLFLNRNWLFVVTFSFFIAR